MRAPLLFGGALLTAALLLPAAPALAVPPDYWDWRSQPSVRYGGQNYNVDLDTEIVRLVEAMAASTDGGQSLYQGLASDAERTRVTERGLEIASVQAEAAPVATDGVTARSAESQATGGAADVAESSLEDNSMQPFGTVASSVSDEATPPAGGTAYSARSGEELDAAKRPWPSYRRSQHVWCTGRSAAGIRLFRWNSRWTWVYTPALNRVRSASHVEWSSHALPFWLFRGSRYLWKTGAVGTSRVGRAVEGTWRLGTPWTSFERKKVIDVVVRGNGTYTGRCYG